MAPPGRGLDGPTGVASVQQGDLHSQGAVTAKKAKLAQARADLNRVGSLTTLEQQWRVNLRGDDSLEGPRQQGWWTGLHPSVCPGAQPDGTLASLPLPVRWRTRPGGATERCARGDSVSAPWEGRETRAPQRLPLTPPPFGRHPELRHRHPRPGAGLLQQHLDAHGGTLLSPPRCVAAAAGMSNRLHGPHALYPSTDTPHSLRRRGGLLPPTVPQPAAPVHLLLRPPGGAVREQAAGGGPPGRRAGRLPGDHLRDGRRRNVLGRSEQERHGLALRCRGDGVPLQGILPGGQLHRQPPGAGHPLRQLVPSYLGPVHGLRARAHPPGDVLCADAGAAAAAGGTAPPLAANPP